MARQRHFYLKGLKGGKHYTELGADNFLPRFSFIYLKFVTVELKFVGPITNKNSSKFVGSITNKNNNPCNV